MSEGIFQLPNKSTPGYLRRVKALTEFQKAQSAESDQLVKLNAMIEFLSGYVTQPANREEAKEALLDASQEQIDELFALLVGKGEEIIPPVSGES